MLKVQHITKTFFPNTINQVKALQNVSLHIPEACFAAVIGTNGSGKSTLLNAVAGTFMADSGHILINDHDITHWPEYKRARLIGRVFQNPFAGTAAEMTIAENIVMAMHRGKPRTLKRAVSSQARREIADRVAQLRMGLEDRLDNPIGTLSGGQRQAITLLMATWLRPKLLLLDEHTAALDPKSAAKVAELTKQIIKQDKLTALMVTHSMQHAVDLPDRIIMMHRGHIVEDYHDEAKKRIRVRDLHDTFDRVQKRELFDEQVADVLKEQYR